MLSIIHGLHLLIFFGAIEYRPPGRVVLVRFIFADRKECFASRRVLLGWDMCHTLHGGPSVALVLALHLDHVVCRDDQVFVVGLDASSAFL